MSEASRRRRLIVDYLRKQRRPVKGGEVAHNFSVSRQVIVQDIAVIRAEGKKIIATPQGYMSEESISNIFRGIIACRHSPSAIGTELETIIRGGGTVLDVIVEHPLYGELKGTLMIKNFADLKAFVKRMEETGAQPLCSLTDNLHLHTLETKDEHDFLSIKRELKEKGILVSE